MRCAAHPAFWAALASAFRGLTLAQAFRPAERPRAALNGCAPVICETRFEAVAPQRILVMMAAHAWPKRIVPAAGDCSRRASPRESAGPPRRGRPPPGP